MKHQGMFPLVESLNDDEWGSTCPLISHLDDFGRYNGSTKEQPIVARQFKNVSNGPRQIGSIQSTCVLKQCEGFSAGQKAVSVDHCTYYSCKLVGFLKTTKLSARKKNTTRKISQLSESV